MNVLEEILDHELTLNRKLITTSMSDDPRTDAYHRVWKYPYIINYCSSYTDLDINRWVYLTRTHPLFEYKCKCNHCQFIIGVDYCDGLSLDYWETKDDNILLVEVDNEQGEDQILHFNSVVENILPCLEKTTIVQHWRENKDMLLRTYYWRLTQYVILLKENNAYKIPRVLSEYLGLNCTVLELYSKIIMHHDELVKLMNLANWDMNESLTNYLLPQIESFRSYHYPEHVTEAIDALRNVK